MNYGDIGSVLINHLQIVIPLSYPCHYTNLCPHKPHKPAHTHTLTHSLSLIHTHTLTLSHTHTHTLSLSHTHTHTLSLSHTHTLSLSHTHTLSLSLSLILIYTHTLYQNTFLAFWMLVTVCTSFSVCLVFFSADLKASSQDKTKQTFINPAALTLSAALWETSQLYQHSFHPKAIIIQKIHS